MEDSKIHDSISIKISEIFEKYNDNNQNSTEKSNSKRLQDSLHDTSEKLNIIIDSFNEIPQIQEKPSIYSSSLEDFQMSLIESSNKLKSITKSIGDSQEKILKTEKISSEDYGKKPASVEINNASPEDANKSDLIDFGGKLYPMVSKLTSPQLVGRITNLLLKMEKQEIMNIIRDERRLKLRVNTINESFSKA